MSPLRTMLEKNGSAQPASPSLSQQTVLIVDGGAEDVVAAQRLLQAKISGLRILHTRSVADSSLLLAQAPVDLVITASTLRDGDCADVVAGVAEWQNGVPVVAVVIGSYADAEVLWKRFPNLLGCLVREAEGAHLLRTPLQYLQAVARAKRVAESVASGGDGEDPVLQHVRRTISRVNHDLNNPLSIISGNAQLLLELAQALELNPELVRPIRDIEEASSRVSSILRRLIDLKESLPAAGQLVGDARAELRDMQTEA